MNIGIKYHFKGKVLKIRINSCKYLKKYFLIIFKKFVKFILFMFKITLVSVRQIRVFLFLLFIVSLSPLSLSLLLMFASSSIQLV